MQNVKLWKFDRWRTTQYEQLRTFKLCSIPIAGLPHYQRLLYFKRKVRLRFQSESALVQQIDAEITEYLASTANVENSTAAEPQAVRFYSDYENCKWGFNFQNISFRDPKTPFSWLRVE